VLVTALTQEAIFDMVVSGNWPGRWIDQARGWRATPWSCHRSWPLPAFGHHPATSAAGL